MPGRPDLRSGLPYCHHAEILQPVFSNKRIRFRPPGLKPTTRIGTIGPYRGRLGVAWVIAPLIAGMVILAAGYAALR
jgi:hypothetical protein